MQKISLHLGSTTFVADKEVLSKPLGVFQTHGALKSATSYNVKSNVQRHVFRVFLSACKSNILPQITPENREQMTQLCEEFQFEALRLFLNRAQPKVPTLTMSSTHSNKNSNHHHATINPENLPKQQTKNDDDDNEFYDNRYWDDVNGVYTNRNMLDDDDVLLPNLNENYFAEQDEIKIKFPINDNNLHN